MAGYVVYARHTLLDPAKNQEYNRGVGRTLEQFGGEPIAIAAAAETLEGDLELPPVTVIRFPSMEHLRSWFDSPEYAPLKQLRLESSTGDLLIFEGM